MEIWILKIEENMAVAKEQVMKEMLEALRKYVKAEVIYTFRA